MTVLLVTNMNRLTILTSFELLIKSYSSVSTSSVNLAASMVLLICASSLLVNNFESVGLASFPIVIASSPFLEIESVTSLIV